MKVELAFFCIIFPPTALTAFTTAESSINSLDSTLQGELTAIRGQMETTYTDCTSHPSPPDCSTFPRGSDIGPVDFTLVR